MKPENRYIKRVHDRIKGEAPEIYCQKFNVAFSNGIFDCWYSGFLEDMWIEYKWLPKMTQTVTATKLLSSLQYDWGRKRAKEGRTVAVCIGSPEGAVWLPNHRTWDKEIKPIRMFSVADMAQEIINYTGRSHDVG